ncbi:MAG: protein phosphatase 2C domain-containing protein [Ruminococcaceae bacterium]|nr:protein phosphatase 2C domain-containing protein [Oscillospiraceae bacterium]
MDRQDNMLHGTEPEELDTESTVQDNSGQVTQPVAENTDTPVEESTPESSPDEGSAGESAPEKMSDRDVMRHTASLWRYRTVAENGTELHTEYHCKHTRTGVGEIIGARVRGKKHKHEGTNCDDWFETAVAEGCFIAVVADGAGSKQLSRIGARVSCEAAVEYLRNEIPEMFSRDRGLRAKLAGDMSGEEFLGACGEFAALIRRSAAVAFDAVIQKLGSLYSDGSYVRVLGRNPTLADMGCTFLAAVAVPVDVNGERQRFVVTLQIGDGCICAIDTRAEHSKCLRLMGEADSGAYSGETEFLSERTVSEDAAARKTRISRGRSDILMLMSDGVADDYFPAQPMMKRLLLDLRLNGILPMPGDTSGRREPAPMEFPAVTPEQQPVAVQYSKQLLKDGEDAVNELWDSRDTLAPWSLEAWGKSLGGTPELRLQNWLDNYSERGSFDDRTLVVMKFDGE